MRERDPYDEFLLHCASDMEPMGQLRTPGALTPLVCSECREELRPSNRFCSNCGTAVRVPSLEENPYNLPVRKIGRLFEVTLLGISQDVIPVDEPSGTFGSDSDEEPEHYTIVQLRIANRTEDRLCLSLTFSQSALVDSTGQQHLPLLREEDDSEGLLDGWFYLYPRAWVEGTLLFPELASPLWHCYLSCQPQDREEELFHFPLR